MVILFDDKKTAFIEIVVNTYKKAFHKCPCSKVIKYDGVIIILTT